MIELSFSSQVKKELCDVYGTGRHCDIAELAGIINTCGSIGKQLRVQTENPAVAKKCFTLLKKTFKISSEISIKNSKALKRTRVYGIYVNDGTQVERVLHSTGLSSTGPEPWKHINPMVVKSDCCKRAYVRGAFIASGSMSDPEKGYHLEVVNPEESLARELLELLVQMRLNPKIILRKAHYVVYLKEGENIVDLLNIMGAHRALLDLENLRILKDMRNNVNRMVNCETANLNKVVTAAVTQIEDIRYIQQTKGFGYLSEQLEDVALLRLRHPEASLKEIGDMLTPTVGKSGVNHRLRKISEIAENLRGGLV